MRDEQWIFHENFSVFGQIENLWKGAWHCFEDTFIKFKETELVEISWLPRMWIPAHYAYNAEMNLKSTTTNGFHFFFYNEFINGVCLTCLTVTLISNEHPHLFHIGDPPPLYPQHSIPLVKGLYSLSLYKTPIPRPIDQIIHTNKKLKRLYSVIIYTNCHHKAVVLNCLL